MSGPRALCGEELKIFKTKKGFMSRMRIRFFKSMAGFGSLEGGIRNPATK